MTIHIRHNNASAYEYLTSTTDYPFITNKEDVHGAIEEFLEAMQCCFKAEGREVDFILDNNITQFEFTSKGIERQFYQLGKTCGPTAEDLEELRCLH